MTRSHRVGVAASCDPGLGRARHLRAGTARAWQVLLVGLIGACTAASEAPDGSAEGPARTGQALENGGGAAAVRAAAAPGQSAAAPAITPAEAAARETAALAAEDQPAAMARGYYLARQQAAEASLALLRPAVARVEAEQRKGAASEADQGQLAKSLTRLRERVAQLQADAQAFGRAASL